LCCLWQAEGPARVEVTFRLLVPTTLIGMVLGRNGDIVKQIRAETGARVKVGGELCGGSPGPPNSEVIGSIPAGEKGTQRQRNTKLFQKTLVYGFVKRLTVPACANICTFAASVYVAMPIHLCHLFMLGLAEQTVPEI
jgi:hypothetical protein